MHVLQIAHRLACWWPSWTLSINYFPQNFIITLLKFEIFSPVLF